MISFPTEPLQAKHTVGPNPLMYNPYPHQEFEGLERDLWFETLAEHIRPQAESEPYVTDLARVASLPKEVAAIYFLWEFYSEVGGNGIEYYLLEPQGVHAPLAHEALRMVGASELVERLEAGIPHALASGSAEFSASPDLTWFHQFQPNPKYPTLQSADEDINELAADDLRDKCTDFIERHRNIFVR